MRSGHNSVTMQTPLLDKMVIRQPRTAEQLRIAKEELDKSRLTIAEINPLTGHEIRVLGRPEPVDNIKTEK